MKRIVMVMALAAVAVSGFAQYAGSVLVGGSFGGYMNTDLFVEETATAWTNLSVTGQGGYFLVDGLEVGPWLSFRYEKAATGSTDFVSTSRDAYLGVQAGYFIPTGSRIAPYVQLVAAYRMWKDVETTGGTITYENDGGGIVGQVRLGLEYLLADSVGLNAGTYLQYYGNEWGSWYDLRVFFGLDVFLGPFGG